MILCAGNTETFSFAKPIGVGLVESAIGATQLAMKYNEDLVFIGTAGSYDVNFAPIGSVFYVKNCYQIELRGETPFAQKIEVEKPTFVSRETNWALCNSSSYITTDQNDAMEFTKLGLQIENMELFSIFSVAKKFNRKALGILYVTNLCDENARIDYRNNLKSAMEVLTNVINF